MTKEELLQKLTEIEWDDFECKRALEKLSDDVWTAISAFSNTSGGGIALRILTALPTPLPCIRPEGLLDL